MMIKMTFHTVIFSASNSFRQPATVPLSSETHGGDDVAIFAIGPQAHLFQGVYEQHYIAHVMAYAACLGSGVKFCDNVPEPSAAPAIFPSQFVILFWLVLFLFSFSK